MIIAFTGKKYHGKDTAAGALRADGWEQTAFADPLREMLYTLNPAVRVGNPGGEITRWQEAWDTVGYDVMKTWPEVRRLMQVFGTEVMREQVDDRIWINLTMRKMTGPNDNPKVNWAISDLRFDNEAQAVRAAGGHVIEVVWSGTHPRGEDFDEHSSEAGISRALIDGTVYNGLGRLDEFKADVRRMVEVLTR